MFAFSLTCTLDSPELIESVQTEINVASVGATEEFLGLSLASHVLEALPCIGLFAHDLVPKRMVLCLHCVDHYSCFCCDVRKSL